MMSEEDEDAGCVIEFGRYGEGEKVVDRRYESVVLRYVSFDG